MRGWLALGSLVLVLACSDDDGTGPGSAPDAPATLTSTSLDEAVALLWSDNSYTTDPDLFEAYRVYSTSYDLDLDRCGTDWQLEGTTVAPEFIVSAMTNGRSRCFAVTAMSVDGGESPRSPVRADTPRPDARNVLVYARQAQDAGSGFRFWDDLNDDQVAQPSELGIVRAGSSLGIDFAVERDGSGLFSFVPVRAGTGVELYDEDDPVEDLTTIDFAVDRAYADTPLEAAVGFGYVFEMDGGDGFARYGAVRVTHVGRDFLILDWAFQTDPGNPELIVTRR